MLRDAAQGQMGVYLIRSLQIFLYVFHSTLPSDPALMTTQHVNTTQDSTLQIRPDGGGWTLTDMNCTDTDTSDTDISTAESGQSFIQSLV